MAVQWEKVHVFISSTFNDMHAERDYLVKQVFPRLQEWCERRKLRLVDIDLRWGVTEADATQNKRVVQVCLERIDACRPFFLCFLGQRRGWVPDRSDISPETYAAFPELARYAGDASVTELEILHALVNPLHRGRVVEAGGAREYAPTEHTFFHLRGDMYLGLLRGEVPLLREIYTNEGIADPGARGRADVELGRWRAREIPGTGRPVHAYTARWNPAASTPEIRLPLQCPSTAERGSAVWQSALARWSAQWEQAGVRVDADGQIGDSAERQKAERFNARLSQGRLGGFTCEGRPLVDIVLEDLQAAIRSRYPEHVEAVVLTPLQRELDQQAQFIQAAGEGFIERQGDFSALDGYLRDDSARPFFLTAPGGLGKTSLLARWIDRAQLSLKDGESLHYRFIGASDGSTTADALLRSLLVELKEVAGKLEEEIPAGTEKLRAALPGLLAAAGKPGKTVLMLDGLNQLETGMDDLAWLPLALPPGIKLVISFKRGEPQAETYFETLRAGGQARLAEVRPFESMEDRRRLVRAYLSQYLKELDERHQEALVHSEGASNPLYLKVVLAELRVFGAFADLGARIREDFGENPVSAFAGLLRRLESDPAYSPIQPERLVPRLFGWLAHSRTGLTAEELGGLLVREGLLPDDEAGRQRAEEAVNGLLRQVRPYLARREGRSDFFYESLKLAVLERCVTREEQTDAHPESRPAREWHASLAAYFDAQPLRMGADQTPNRRKLAEAAYQFAHAGMGEPLQDLLWDYRYLEARLQSSGVETLIADYGLADLAEAGLGLEGRRRLSLLQGALRLSAHVLSRDPRQLPCQLTGRLLACDEEEFRNLLEQAGRETSVPWLRPMSASLDAPGAALLRTLTGHVGKENTVAVTADGRLVVDSAGNTLRVRDLASGRELRSLVGHSDSVTALALTADGRLAVSGSEDKTLKVWDLASGGCLRTLAGHTDVVSAVVLSADGRLAISAQKRDYVKDALRHGLGAPVSMVADTRLRVWDVASGRELRALAGHEREVTAIALAADGRFAISGSGKTLILWDVASGQELRTMTSHAHEVSCVAITPDGRLAVSAAHDGTLKVWDVVLGKELRTLAGHGLLFTTVAITADGRLAVSGSDDRTIKVWEVASGRELSTLTGHTGWVRAVAVTPDARLAVSGSWDGTLKVWDLATTAASLARGRWLSFLSGHRDLVRAVALTPDGRFAISASKDKSLIVWDVPAGKELCSLAGHKETVTAVAMTPDGRLAVSASEDKSLKVWDLESGRELRTLSGHRQEISAVALTADGRVALSAAYKTLKVWDVLLGTELQTLPGDAHLVEAVAMTPDGQRAVSTSGKALKVWDLASGQRLCTLSGGHSAPIRDVALTPDGRLAISASEDWTLQVWDIAAALDAGDAGAAVPRTLPGHGGPVNSVAVTPDGSRAISASEDHVLKVWNLESGEEVCTLAGHAEKVTAVTVAADGRLAASAAGNVLAVWELPSGQDRYSPAGHRQQVTAVAFALDGRLAVTGSSDRTLKVWDVASGRVLRTLAGHASAISGVVLTPDGRRALTASWDGTLKVWDFVRGRLVRTLAGHREEVTAVALAADGQLAVSASIDKTLIVWDVMAGRKLRALVTSARVRSVALTPDGRLAVSRSDDDLLKVWVVATKEELHSVAVRREDVIAMALTPAGLLAVSGSYDTLRVWDVVTAKELRILGGHLGAITAVALTPDGRLAVSISGGIAGPSALKVWEMATGREILSLDGPSSLAEKTIAVTPDGRLAVSQAKDGTMCVWDISAGHRTGPASGSALAVFMAEGGGPFAVSPDGQCLAVGDDSGRVSFLRLENLTAGRYVVTAWRALEGPASFGCPHCRTWSEVPESAFGTDLPCPHCGQVVRLNPFAIDADWRPVAEAWMGRG